MDTLVRADTGHELRIGRRIPAPPETVFAAWTEAGQVKRWMAPYCMEVAEAGIELRPGGHFRTLMRDAAGKEYRSVSTILELDRPRRLVTRMEGGDCGPFDGVEAVVDFTPAPYGTDLVVHFRHATEGMKTEHERMGFFVGWGQTLDRLVAHVLTPAQTMPGLKPPAPQHGWLSRMLGDWDVETEFAGAPGQPPTRATGVERVRPLGPFWVVGEMTGECPGGGGPSTMIVQMGFDPDRQRFTGSWVSSMMPHMFAYEGALDDSARVLTLDTTGPSCTGDGSTAQYRDTVEMVSETERLVTSHMLQPEAPPLRIMTARFKRRG
jgi:uncharacterized protein YndB with AHSA1/START domain